MADPGLPPKPRSLNLLESLIQEEEEQARVSKTPSRSCVIHSQHYDVDKQAISRDNVVGSYSVYEMNETVTSSQVVRCDPNAGFRGKKMKKQTSSERVRTSQSSLYNPSESFLKKRKTLQRPFSADYSRNKRDRSNRAYERAKSAKATREYQTARSPDGWMSDPCSSDEEKENGIESKQLEHDRDHVGIHDSHTEQRQNTLNDSGTDSSSTTMSSDEENKPTSKTMKQKAAKSLRRQKKQKLRVFQSDPEKFYGDKLQQKYLELKKLMANPLNQQKSQMLQHHLQQMEQLNDQYKAASHGLLCLGPLIPRSLPEDIRIRSQRPTSSRPLLRRSAGPSQKSYEREHSVTLERVEPISTTGRTQPDTQSTTGVIRSDKKKETIEAKLTNSHTDTDRSKSEEGSVTTTTSPPAPTKASALDHHVKFSDNDYLRKWLKQKDKQHRKKVREEKRKMREEKERLILEANEKLERKIQSQKVVESWMKEKGRETNFKYKEMYRKYKNLEKSGVYDQGPNLPGDSIRVKTLDRSADDSQMENREICSKRRQNTQPVNYNRENNVEIHQTEVPESYKMGGQHPPQTKFMYKRPAAGQISFNMQVRGTSPFSPRQDCRREDKEDNDGFEQTNLPYDEWTKKKSENDRAKQRTSAHLDLKTTSQGHSKKSDSRNDEKQTMDRDLNYLNKREIGSYKERYGSANAPERNNSLAEPRETDKRPSTAPRSRERAPHPKESSASPRQQSLLKVAQTWGNVQNTNDLPFPPEKGIPAHVDTKQRNLFAGKVSEVKADEPLHSALVNESATIEEPAFKHLDHVEEEHWSEIELSEDLSISGSTEPSSEISEAETNEETQTKEKNSDATMNESKSVFAEVFEHNEKYEEGSNKDLNISDELKEKFQLNKQEQRYEHFETSAEKSSYESIHKTVDDQPLKLTGKLSMVGEESQHGHKQESSIDINEPETNLVEKTGVNHTLESKSEDQNSKSVRYGRDDVTDEEIDLVDDTIRSENRSRPCGQGDMLENLDGLPLIDKVLILKADEPIDDLLAQERSYEELRDLPLVEKVERLKEESKDQNRNPI